MTRGLEVRLWGFGYMTSRGDLHGAYCVEVFRSKRLNTVVLFKERLAVISLGFGYFLSRIPVVYYLSKWKTL